MKYQPPRVPHGRRGVVVFVDGVHVHVPPRRARRLRPALFAIGIRSEVVRATRGVGQLVCFSIAGVEGLFLAYVVSVLQEHRARVLRIELAADVLDVEPDAADALALRTLRLMRRPGRAPERAGGRAVAYIGNRHDRLTVAIYSDRPSKRSPGPSRVCHIELRVNRVMGPENLLAFDPAFHAGRARIVETLERETTWGSFIAALVRARTCLHT